MDLQYTIKHISVLEYRITEKGPEYAISADACQLNADITMHFNTHAEEVIFHYLIRYTDKRSEEELMIFRIKMIFRIVDFKKAFPKKGEDLTVSEAVLLNFVRLVTGAARGMMALQNKGSYLQDIYLPVHNDMEVVHALKNQLSK
jgi:hypothetical protein